MKTYDDPKTLERATLVVDMMAERLRTMTPQERDRMMQRHLAQARGETRNTTLLFEMTAMLLQARQLAGSEEPQNE